MRVSRISSRRLGASSSGGSKGGANCLKKRSLPSQSNCIQGELFLFPVILPC